MSSGSNLPLAPLAGMSSALRPCCCSRARAAGPAWGGSVSMVLVASVVAAAAFCSTGAAWGAA